MHISRLRRNNRGLLAAWGLAYVILGIPAALPAAEVTISQILAYKPKHFDLDYDIPAPAQYAACKVNVIRHQRTSGWEVMGPQGQTIRRFMDTNGDNHVDQWSYFHNGLEVYRDIDSNGNNKFDQARWLNTGGSRWAVDANEDGHIDGWKSLSPEELSQVVIRALIKQDVALLNSLVVTKDDLEQLGVTGGVDRKILEAVQDPETHFRKVATNFPTFLNPATKWLQFNGSSPSVIPVEQLGVKQDLFVYENTMAVVDLGGGGAAAANTGLVQLGELVRVGNVWKLTSLPMPQGEKGGQIMVTGLLMQAGANSAPEQKVAPGDPKVQKLVEQLQDLDKLAPVPTAGRAEVVAYYKARLSLLDQLVRASQGKAEEQEQWIRQIADFLASGIQSDAYPDGAGALRKWEAYANAKHAKTPLATHISYRRMLGDYTVAMKQANNEDRQKVQDRWLKDFETFVIDHPRSEEGADSAWQIAVINEFNGKQDIARKWYERLVADNVQAQATERATGALRRLNLNGKSLDLAGPTLQGQQLDLRTYRDRMVLVIFWSTWCKPCTEDLPQVKALYQQYKAKGFEVVGINLDTQQQLIPPYVQQHGMDWPSIFQGGGLESPLARQYGIISLPTMFLVGRDGKVINRNAAVVDVKNTLTNAFKKDE